MVFVCWCGPFPAVYVHRRWLSGFEVGPYFRLHVRARLQSGAIHFKVHSQAVWAHVLDDGGLDLVWYLRC